MHRNFSNCVAKHLALLPLTIVIVSCLSIKDLLSDPFLLDQNTQYTSKTSQNNSFDGKNNTTIMSLLEATGNIIDKGDEILHEMNETIHKAEYYLTKNDSKEFFSTLPVPWTIEEIKPKLVFYRHDNTSLELSFKMKPREMALKLQEENFLNTSRLIFITHGFHNDFNAPWLEAFKNSILTVSKNMKYPQTVAVIGWGGGADLLVFRYRQAASNVIPVGKLIAQITTEIKNIKKDLPIYGIGHSLGAHVMGVAGRESKAFNRISGVDPAGPCFEKVDNSLTLNYNDAEFVDIIHTDGYDSKLDPSEWIFPVNHYGSLVPIGTIDFYPNFGYHQPNAGTFTVAGSHLRALDLFLWSIENPGKFVTSAILNAVPDYDNPIEEWIPGKYKVEMGYYADRYQLPPGNATDISRLFYIKTNGQAPWI